jgi:hypothetical protein
MKRKRWEADPSARMMRRWGKANWELATDGTTNSDGTGGCPESWELENGDVAFIGRDLTATYASILPEGVMIGADERLIVIPRAMIISAKEDIPDA